MASKEEAQTKFFWETVPAPCYLGDFVMRPGGLDLHCFANSRQGRRTLAVRLPEIRRFFRAPCTSHPSASQSPSKSLPPPATRARSGSAPIHLRRAKNQRSWGIRPRLRPAVCCKNAASTPPHRRIWDSSAAPYNPHSPTDFSEY